jgi:HlyD family secretion protein
LKFVIIGIVALAALGVVSTAGVWLTKGAIGRSTGGTAVRVEKVARGDLVEFVSASGEVEPKTKVSISARVAARIAELPYDEGDVVKKGDVLVRFDDKDLRANLDSVKARYDSEEAQLTVTGIRIRAQEAQLRAQKISLADAERDLRRQKQLFETKDVSESVVDTAQAKVDNLYAQVVAAEQSLEADKAGLLVLRHNLDAAKAEISRAEDNLSYATIQSPIDGIVTKVEAEVGEVALMGTMNNPGTVLLNVADLSKILLVAHVDEASIANIKVGQKAKVRMQAYGDEVFEGEVYKMALKNTEERLTNTKFFEVEVLLKTDGRRIPSGLNGDAEIETNRLEGVLKIPSQAVVGRQVETLPPDVRYKPEVDQKKTIASVVYRFVDGKAVVTPVTVGASDVTHTVIKSGLSEGDAVITGPYKVLEQVQHDWRVSDESLSRGPATRPAATAPAAGK